jgi:hypothetical protein
MTGLDEDTWWIINTTYDSVQRFSHDDCDWRAPVNKEFRGDVRVLAHSWEFSMTSKANPNRWSNHKRALSTVTMLNEQRILQMNDRTHTYANEWTLLATQNNEWTCLPRCISDTLSVRGNGSSRSTGTHHFTDQGSTRFSAATASNN